MVTYNLADRVAETTATTGTGTITLGGAISDAFLTFLEAGIANMGVPYLITDGDDFEIGVGVVNAGSTTLTRDTVHVSKIGGTAGTAKSNLSGSGVEVRLVPHTVVDYTALDRVVLRMQEAWTYEKI